MNSKVNLAEWILGIGDFKGLADYAWDWSTPGGAPGWGPMLASDDIGKLLARAIGELMPPAEELVEPVPDITSAEALPAPETREMSEAETPITHEPDEDRANIRRRGGRAAPV